MSHKKHTDKHSHDLRAAEKINYPNLLVSRLVFYVLLIGEYLDMHRLASLEFEPTSCAIWDN